MSDATALMHKAFVGWQCRLRQQSIRRAGGRPTSGMRPNVIADDGTALGHLTVVLVKQDTKEATAAFRQIARQTHDPAERYDRAIKYLSAAYYQRPESFAEAMTGLFAASSGLANRLVREANCLLAFEQYNQRFDLPCTVRRLTDDDPTYQATYWHNALFTQVMPVPALVLSFAPDWMHSTVLPSPADQNLR